MNGGLAYSADALSASRLCYRSLRHEVALVIVWLTERYRPDPVFRYWYPGGRASMATPVMEVRSPSTTYRISFGEGSESREELTPGSPTSRDRARVRVIGSM